MNILYFWEKRAGGLTLDHKCNPQAGILYQALKKHDIHLEYGDYSFGKRMLEERREVCEVIHFNWLHYFYRFEDLETATRKYARFVENLHYAKKLDYRIVWTMHNLFPHERPYPPIDRAARFLISNLADTIVCHCNYGAELVKKFFFRKANIHIIPHVNFIDIYPNDITGGEARQKLNLPLDGFNFLFFGKARVYKGIENLILSFREIAKKDENLLLMLQTAPHRADYTEKLIDLAKASSQIHVFTSSYFPDEDFQIYINAADIIVLPFRDILTSGSAITALSFGKPIIVPKIGCMPEIVSDNIGLTYEANGTDEIKNALRKARFMDVKAAGKAAFKLAQTFDCDLIAEQWADLYRG